MNGHTFHCLHVVTSNTVPNIIVFGPLLDLIISHPLSYSFNTMLRCHLIRRGHLSNSREPHLDFFRGSVLFLFSKFCQCVDKHSLLLHVYNPSCTYTYTTIRINEHVRVLLIPSCVCGAFCNQRRPLLTHRPICPPFEVTCMNPLKMVHIHDNV